MAASCWLLLACTALAAGETSAPWHLAAIRAPEAWALQPDGGAGQVVAVIDAGIRASHQDLAGQVADIPGWDTIQRGPLTRSSNHGTACLALAVGRRDSPRGTAGVAWGARGLPIAALTHRGVLAQPEAEAEALDYACRMGATVVSCSFGDMKDQTPIVEALKRCRAAGVIVVVAGSNEGVDLDTGARDVLGGGMLLDNLLVVGAHDRQGRSAMNHSAGYIQIDAPGKDILCATSASDQAYTINSGSSEATPLVAGAIALLRARHPKDDHRAIINRLLRGSRREATLVGRNAVAGRLDVAAALAMDTPRPPGDRFAERIPLGCEAGTAWGSTWHAEADPQRPGGVDRPALWWTWEPPHSGSAWIGASTAEGERIALHAFVDGEQGLQRLTLQADGDGWRLTCEGGRPIHLAASSDRPTVLRLTLVAPPPDNQDPASPEDLGREPTLRLAGTCRWVAKDAPAPRVGNPLAAFPAEYLAKAEAFGDGWLIPTRIGKQDVTMCYFSDPLARLRWYRWHVPKSGVLQVEAQGLPSPLERLGLVVFDRLPGPDAPPIVSIGINATGRPFTGPALTAGATIWLGIGECPYFRLGQFDPAGKPFVPMGGGRSSKGSWSLSATITPAAP